MTTEQVVVYIRDLDTSIKYQLKIINKYFEALKRIQQIGINESDSVLAATEMERIAREALK